MTQGNKCLVCGSSDTALKFTCIDHLTRKESFNIHACTKCGFKFTFDPPPENEAGKYYDDSQYISHSNTRTGVINTLYHFTRSLMLRRKRSLIRRVTGLNTGTLFDIGCGTGYFAGFMKESGWKVTGLEINEKARDHAREKFGLEVIDQPQLSGLESGIFDCITLWHVFEHFYDPVGSFTAIRRLLKPGGRCIIAMPNSSSPDARHYGRHWAAWDVPRHLWHFDPDTFISFAANNGLKVTGIKSLPADVFYISLLSEKYRSTNMPFVTGMIKGLWFAMLTMFNRRRSSSVIYILDPIS
ncbi:MAG: class I SAM-dependent methyltransferase [Bacteroidota bacterium]